MGDQLDEVVKCLFLDLSTSSDGTDGSWGKQIGECRGRAVVDSSG